MSDDWARIRVIASITSMYCVEGGLLKPVFCLLIHKSIPPSGNSLPCLLGSNGDTTGYEVQEAAPLYLPHLYYQRPLR